MNERDACSFCREPMSHYMTHVCKGCDCHYTAQRIPGEPHIPSYLEMEPNPECPIHFPEGED